MRPLEGIKVLALETFIAGPLATMWLADAGADVVKVERPGAGDQSRYVPPMKETDGARRSLSFIRSNRNKRSIALDLKSETDRARFDDLLARADVFVQNLRPGATAGLGLTYGEVRRVNPRIIYASISGFGVPEANEGDLPYLASLDIVAQAMSGLLYRPEGAEERPIYPGFPLADIFASSNLHTAIYQALFHRQRTGEGAFIDISMTDGAVVLNELALILHGALGTIPAAGLHALTSPFGAFRAKDGFVVIGVLGEPVWRRFTKAIDRPDIAEIPEFETGVLRHQNRDKLHPLIDEWLSDRTVEAALERLRAHDVPASPIHNVDQVIRDEYLWSRGAVVTVEDPVWGPTVMAGNPIHGSLMEKVPLAPPPELGCDSAAVERDWLGRDD